MPAVQYPFIDIAVHERVRERFARGEAILLFSRDMERVLWANGVGSGLFGNPGIYDFLDEGPNRGDVTFRQMEATARQLRDVGDRRTFLMRIAAGFQRVAVQADVEMIRTQAGEVAILFSAPVTTKPLSVRDCARQMLQGFDDPDIHMAVLGDTGDVIAASPGFDRLAITPHTAQTLVTMVSNHADRLMKRPVPTGRGYLPAAVGKLSEKPGLYLLFAVETAIGNLDPTGDFTAKQDKKAVPAPAEAAPTAETAPVADAQPAAAFESLPLKAGYADALEAVAGIEELNEAPEEDRPQAALPDSATSGHTAAPAGDVALAEAEQAEPEQATEPEAASQEALPDDGIATGPQDDLLTGPDRTAAAILAHDIPAVAEPGPSETATGSGGERAGAEPILTAGADTATLMKTIEATGTGMGEILPETMVAPSASPDEAAALPDDEQPEPGFTFNRSGGRPTRFVWKIDAEGRFSEVSGEFAAAVGPHAAAINGVAFTDLAHLFNLDPEGKVIELLGRRDTWSGKTIYWPIEGTRLKVPVDLAALPTYTRTRLFDGFRGFGIVRLADAVDDPLELGLTLVPGARPALPDEVKAEAVGIAAAQPADIEAETIAKPDAAEPDLFTDDPAHEWPAAETPVDIAGTDEAGADVFRAVDDIAARPKPPEPHALILPWGERPALRLVETPARAASDKIVQLDDRRSRGREGEGLSPGEQAAFREIARQLQPFGKRGNDEISGNIVEPEGPPSATPENQTTLFGGTPDAGSDRSPAVMEAAAEPEAIAHEPSGNGQSAEDRTGSVENPAVAGDQNPREADIAATVAEKPGRAAETDDAPGVISNLLPPRAKMTDGLSREIIDQMPVALLVHAGDTLIHANPEFLRLTGYGSLDELKDVGGLDALLHSREGEEPLDHPGAMTPGAMILVRADDALVPVTARLQSVRWEQANALMLALMPVAQDRSSEGDVPDASTGIATGQKHDRLVEKLAKVQGELEELHSILETATDGVVTIGQEGEIRSMNRSASALFNYDNEETHGKPFVMLFAHESQKAVVDYLGGLAGHGVASVLNDGREVIGREAGGGFIPLFMTMGRLTASNGYCAVIRDITQWKRTEDELRNAKRAAETANAHKSDFLARVSHEIRTPLNAIIGFSDMMATERFGAIGHPRYVEYANDIGRSGRHVLDIVNDLLDISKIEAGEMDLEFTAVGLNETISEAVSLVQPQANSQRVIIRTSLSQAVPNVVADLRSIKQIALNILSNAIRFTPSGGQIVVSTSYETSGSVVLRIRDTGVGMTRSELEQAMKPFRQVTTGARKRGDGTGLGLPLTKAMVDANRASFSINSAPNEGTLVEITFPSPRVLAN